MDVGVEVAVEVHHLQPTLRVVEEMMFQDEAGFGRINKPKRCWCPVGIRPSVPCHHIREYRYLYGAVSPVDGKLFSLVLPYTNTICMNVFLRELSKAYPNDYILLVVDNAAWHNAGALQIPENIQLFPLPPYTPELNPIEMLWDEIREKGFRNQVFASLEKVVDRLCGCVRSLSANTARIASITHRAWFIDALMF
jgi:putative transposase